MKGRLHRIEVDLESEWDWDAFDHWRFLWEDFLNA